MKNLLVVILVAALLPTAAAEAKNLRWSSQGEISTLDPHANNESFNNNQNNQVYEYLVQRDRNTYAKYIPWLAVSWQNVEATKWIVKLRPGVRFHDGSPFTADDVVFSYDRARIANSTFKLYSTQAGIPRKIDDLTVEFVTPVPNPLFHESIGTIFIMSKAWSEKNNAAKPQDYRGKEDAYTARNAMGTGPFRLVAHEPGVRTRYEKNPDWWALKEGGFPGNVDTVDYRVITNSATRMAALRSGEIDFVLDPPVQEVEQLRRDRTLKVWEGTEIRVIFVALDQGRDELINSDAKGRNPFKDKRVRQALYHSIDIEAIRKQVMRGLSEPTAILLPDPKGAGVPAALDQRLAFDPVRARKLLAEAGYPDGFSFTLSCPNDRYINDEKICTALAAMWARIGVRTKVEASPRAQYFPYLAKLEANAYLYGWGGGSSEGIWILKPILHTRNTSGAGDNNFARVSHARLDQLTAAIESEMDTTKRHAMVAEAARIIQEDTLALPLHRQVIPWVSKGNITVTHRPNNALMPAWVTVK
ncbi:MAG: ABC transporter substrate-binding protein [Pseudomonadota bacterium]|nr:ABC transporter substrate-binding protein [Pseudomonadota bacterium]